MRISAQHLAACLVAVPQQFRMRLQIAMRVVDLQKGYPAFRHGVLRSGLVSAGREVLLACRFSGRAAEPRLEMSLLVRNVELAPAQHHPPIEEG